MRIDIRLDQGEAIDEIQYGNDTDQYVELLCNSIEISDASCDSIRISSGADIRNLAKALIKAADLKGW